MNSRRPSESIHLQPGIIGKDEVRSRLAKRFGRMKADLVTWQQSVINSLNGRDYR